MNELLARDDLVTAGSDRRPADHPAVAHGRVGVLLLNLGTPDATSYWPMRRYLKQFLSDRRVIEEPRWKWWPILNLIILTTRPGRKGKDYETIWNKERDEGPLKTITRSQAEELARRLGDKPRVLVDWAMRYANPSTDSRIRALQEQGCERLLLVPLYPQYAAATTATACDEAFRALMKLRWQPAVRVAPAYFDDPAYIGALAESMRKSLAALDFEPERIIATFHGMPEKYLLQGDPYHCQCQKTSRLLRDELGWPGERWLTTFQSRFGTDPWLQPYTDETVGRLAREGVKRLALVAPGFSADCLETLEELDRENREIFVHGGGEKFAYLPALNDSEEGVRVIEGVVRRELQGWA
jgi:ferrochelatase